MIVPRLDDYVGDPAKISATKKRLKALGATIQPPTEQWEVLRFRTAYGTGVVYRNAKERFKATELAMRALAYLESGKTAPIPPKARRRKGEKTSAPARPGATVFADASYCRRTGAAGWGAWVVGNGKAPSTGGGGLKGLYHNSMDAEAAALANALHLARARGYLAAGSTVMLQCDNSPVLSHVRLRVGAADAPMADDAHGIQVPRGRKPPQRQARDAMDAIATVAAELQLTIVVRHVRGHRDGDASTGDGRAWVNRECDRLAKLGMRRRRDELRGEIPFSPLEQPQEAATA